MNNNKDDYAKKALVVTTVASTLDQFCMSDISILQKFYKVYVAANFSVGNNTSKERVKEFKLELQKNNIVVSEINFDRNPFSKSNFLAYREIRKLINGNSFELIHCHTPVAAMEVRLAAKEARKKGTRVIYTAHGFHFFNGAPLKNWILFYPIERWLARYTDVLITINEEDYNRAKKAFKAGKIEYIPGVGINTKEFGGVVVVDKSVKRRNLGIPEDAFVVFSVGELNENKNHETVIKAIAKLNNPNVYYVICGQGLLEDYLKDLIKKLGLEKQVKLLGYRRDIAEISKVVDIFAFPSRREGLGLAALEAMASGLPIITSKIHGIVDYSIDGETGYTCSPTDVEGFVKAINKLMLNEKFIERMGNHNIEVVKNFDIEVVKKIMDKIYFNK